MPDRPPPPVTFPILSADIEAQSLPPLGSHINVLMVWPRFPTSFWGFEGMFQVVPESASMPPLGLITVAALCPPSWRIRLIDCAFEEVRDEDIRWAGLVMVSAMQAQREGAIGVLTRARALGCRTFLGGPWASSEPEAVLPYADHVMVGEAEEVLAEIAAALEQGTAHRLYRVADKPDMSRAVMPRYDLLRLSRYTSMAIQFSRGCPFQCEFCDIITIYGRRPRTKDPASIVAELDELYRLGWRKQVFLVDDNFIGNHKEALRLALAITGWQRRHGYPLSLYTEASIDLAERDELIAAMVEANFLYVFIGIETPSTEALKECLKFQNLRRDVLDRVRHIQESGLWVMAGFIVGFDSDDETIFDRQFQFIERAAIPWAMVGILQAVPTTALTERLTREGRMVEGERFRSIFAPPNFRTVMPLPVLLRGLSRLLAQLFEPEPFFNRAFRSLEAWNAHAPQRHCPTPFWYSLRTACASLWQQGIRSNYRRHYWQFLWRISRNWLFHPAKWWVGFMVLLSAHHFLSYSRLVEKSLDEAWREFDRQAENAAEHKAAPVFVA
jgi:radical SAM superfamily enzyme YgiQ (UPF0313 family)